MTTTERNVVLAAAILFLGLVAFGVAYIMAGAFKTAQSPEHKCRQVMAQITQQQGPLSVDVWNAGYQACLSKERSG